MGWQFNITLTFEFCEQMSNALYFLCFNGVLGYDADHSNYNNNNDNIPIFFTSTECLASSSLLLALHSYFPKSPSPGFCNG